jgi:DNA-binding beta-propeller fold protein YncE
MWPKLPASSEVETLMRSRIMLNRRRLLTGAASLSTTSGLTKAMAASPAEQRTSTLLLSDSAASTITFLDLADDHRQAIEVGAAPWGVSRLEEHAFVATAEGVAVLDLATRERTALIPYESQPGETGYGEYRPGGMGIAASPLGELLFVGNYLAGGPSRLEVIAWREERVVGSVETGIRPFDVVASRDGREAYSIDHDSYTVTVLDVEAMTARILPVSPLGDALGLAGFEKPHYAVLDPDGMLLLPFQGQVLARFDPAIGRYESIPLEANTHQHGIAINPAGDRVLIVGTGPAGGATGGASLTVMELPTARQTIVPLDRPHERVAFSPDERFAYLTGGYSFAGGGWDGITVVDLQEQTATEIEVGKWPLDLLVL